MNFTVYCRLAWPKKCIISVKCVTSTTLGDTQRMLGLLRGAPGVVSYFRRKTARCVSRNGPKSDRCHLGDESPNLSGIGLRCVSCNRPQVNRTWNSFNKQVNRTWNSFNKHVNRTCNSFNKHVNRTWNSFNKQVNRTWNSFNKQVNRTWNSFNKQVNRTWNSFNKQVNRTWNRTWNS